MKHMNDPANTEVLILKEEGEWIIGQMSSEFTDVYIFCKICMYAQFGDSHGPDCKNTDMEIPKNLLKTAKLLKGVI